MAFQRQILHFLFSIPAFFGLTTGIGLTIATLGLMFNAFFFRRISFLRRLMKNEIDPGILLYPLSVLLAFALFPADSACLSWVVMGWGDPLVSLAVFWEKDRTGKGLMGGILFFLGAVLGGMVWLYIFMPVGRFTIFLVSLLVTAVVERLTPGNWDNLTVVLTFCTVFTGLQS